MRFPGNEDASSGNALHKLLTTALSSRMSPKEKEDILENGFGIPMNYELKEATAGMCNLADLVEERGIEKGIVQGANLNVIQLVLKKLKKSYSVSQIAEQLEETDEKISRIIRISEKYAPDYDERQILKEFMSENSEA